MKSKSKVIYVDNIPVNVSDEVYHAYWEEREKERFQNKQYRKYVLSIDITFGSQDYNPLELELLNGTNPTLEYILEKELYELLVRVLFSLDPEEINLIIALYFDEISQTDFARSKGVTKQSISKKHRKIIEKLKFLIEK